MGCSASKEYPPLVTVENCESNKLMGTWFVIGVKPTPFETTCSNAVETYTRKYDHGYDIDIDFKYNKNEPITSPLKSVPQRGWLQGPDKENTGNWKVSPFACIRMPYPIIEVDNVNYNWIVVGHEGRNYVWIMARTPSMDESLYESLKQRLVDKHGYDLEGLRKVPQKWTADERAKRNLQSVISAEFLV